MATTEKDHRQATVLFSRLARGGNTPERLIPGKYGALLARIRARVSHIATRHDGRLNETNEPDVLVAVFDPLSPQEDDILRAIHAARDIHNVVQDMNADVETEFGWPLTVCSGIDSGLAGAGYITYEDDHKVLGNATLSASRLAQIADPGQILLGQAACAMAGGHFDLEVFAPPHGGKGYPGKAARLVLPADPEGRRDRRSPKMRSELIGREVALNRLEGAARLVCAGTGSVVSICGDPGTGKSRLAEHFRNSSEGAKLKWLQGHAYPHTQNVAYAPLVNLIGRSVGIEEGDSQARVRQKLEAGLVDLVGENHGLAPWVGGLFSLDYEEARSADAEFWRRKIRKTLRKLLIAYGRNGPAVICLENLNWADPSTLELIRALPQASGFPVLILLVHRTPLELFSEEERRTLETAGLYREIRLRQLSEADAMAMLASLLATREIPPELQAFVQEKAEGNPFYLEEIVTSLVETEILTHDDQGWHLSRPIRDVRLPSTIHGLVSARLGRLEEATKRVLQEASVIGRSFSREVLKRITSAGNELDDHLHRLEWLDLIRTLSCRPEVHYTFKHAMTHDVVYDEIPGREKRQMHERIGLVMADLFQDRLSEFCEVLSFHFKHGRAVSKGVHYLVQSAEKAWKRYALEEAGQYLQDALELATDEDGAERHRDLIFDILHQWTFVLVLSANFNSLYERMNAHGALAESLEDRARRARYFVDLGIATCLKDDVKNGYTMGRQALALAEEAGTPRDVAEACYLSALTSAELGLLDEATAFVDQAFETCSEAWSDPFLYSLVLSARCHTCFFQGNLRKARETAEHLMEHGRKHNSIRSLVIGNVYAGMAIDAEGDYKSAAAYYGQALKVSVDPVFTNWAKMQTGATRLMDGHFEEAEEVLREVLDFYSATGGYLFEKVINMYWAILQLTRGHMSRGVKMLTDGREALEESGRRCLLSMYEQILGKVYLQFVVPEQKMNLAVAARNLGFLIKTFPVARKRAETHLTRSIQIGEEVGCRMVVAMASLDLGRLCKAKGRTEEARAHLVKAAEIFEAQNAHRYLQQTRETLIGC